jgi:hypothetical protein
MTWKAPKDPSTPLEDLWVSSGKAHTGIQPHVPSSKEINFVPPVNSEGF